MKIWIRQLPNRWWDNDPTIHMEGGLFAFPDTREGWADLARVADWNVKMYLRELKKRPGAGKSYASSLRVLHDISAGKITGPRGHQDRKTRKL